MYFAGLDEFIKRGLEEDLGTGDITTQSCIPEDSVSKGWFRAYHLV